MKKRYFCCQFDATIEVYFLLGINILGFVLIGLKNSGGTEDKNRKTFEFLNLFEPNRLGRTYLRIACLLWKEKMNSSQQRPSAMLLPHLHCSTARNRR